MAEAAPGLRIEPITDDRDAIDAFACVSNAFGQQARDEIWMHMNPGWDTPEGHAQCAHRMAARLSAATRDRNGDPNTIFLKATLPDPREDGKRVIAGVAIWVQLSVVEGFGDRPVEDLGRAVNLDELYPGNETEQRFCRQVDRGLHRRRIEIVKEKETAKADLPAVMVLDLCAVHVDWQRRGIARELVNWGLEEAKRRGGVECLTEASSMGRHVYAKLGFNQEGGELDYGVDEEFKDRSFPSNIFMRTGA